MIHSVFSEKIIGRSAPMQALFTQMDQAAGSDITVLIQGKSGVGKELVARAIHGASKRGHGPMVAVNCGAIPENLVESVLFGHTKGSFTGATDTRQGKFQEASGGTLFLDEIGELRPHVQVKLLRALQEQEVEPVGAAQAQKVDIRLICATHRNLGQMVRDGAFREDLFYRVNVFPINIPDLKARREDIPMLAAHFIEKFCRLENISGKTLSAEALQAITSFDWPGNVRQLENALHRAVVTARGSSIEVSDVPMHHPIPPAEGDPDNALQTLLHNPSRLLTLAEVEDAHIRRVIEACNGNMTKAASVLDIGRATLYRKIKDMGLIAPKPDEESAEVAR